MPTPPWQLAPVGVSGGLDLGTDEIRVEAPRVLHADNVSHETGGRVLKRDGRSVLAERFYRSSFPSAAPASMDNVAQKEVAIADARWVAQHPSGRSYMLADGVLFVADGGRWMQAGFVDQLQITSGYSVANPQVPLGPLPAGGCYGQAGDVEVAIYCNNPVLDSGGHPTQGGNPDAGGTPTIYLLDKVTGARLAGPLRLSANAANQVRCVSDLAHSTCYVMWFRAATNVIQVLPIHGPTIRRLALTPAGVTGSDLVPITPITDAQVGFDAAMAGGRIVVTYVQAAAVLLVRRYLDQAGQLDGAAQTWAPAAGNPSLVAIEVGATTFCVAWADANNVKAREFNLDATLSAVGAEVAVTGAGTRNRLAVGSLLNGWWLILYEAVTTTQTQGHTVAAAWMQTGAAAVSLGSVPNAGLLSRVWVDNGRYYAILAYGCATTDGGGNPIRDLNSQDLILVYMFKPHTAGSTGTGDKLMPVRLLCGAFWNGTSGGVPVLLSAPCDVVIDASRQARTMLRYLQGFYTVPGHNDHNRTYVQRLVIIDHGAQMQPAQVGPDAMYIPGGLLWRVQENASQLIGMAPTSQIEWFGGATEAGFLLGPEKVALASQNIVGGQLVAGASYAYRCYFRDLVTGERSLSAFGEATITVAGGNDAVGLTIPSLTHTARASVVVDIYRRVANAPLSDPYYYVGSVLNEPTSSTVGGSDYAISDADLVARPQDPVSLGQLDEYGPPACSVVAVGDERLALAGIDDEGTIWQSKIRETGEPVRWSALVTARADSPIPGVITAMAWNGPMLIVWRERSIHLLTGRGVDNAGNGAAQEPSRTVSLEVGCRSPTAIVRIPGGWVFQAADGRYWALDGGKFELQYIGKPVQTITDDCLAMYVVLKKRQVRCVCATRTLVLDFGDGQWSLFSVGGVGGCARDTGSGLWLPSASSGKVLVDDATTGLDDGLPFPFVIETAWIRPAGVQGEAFVNRALFAGGYAGPHRPIVRVAYDYEPGFQEHYEWQAETVVNTITNAAAQTNPTQVFGGGARGPGGLATQLYQFGVELGRQRCQALKLRIEDRNVPGSLLGQSLWISDVAIEWAPAAPAAMLEERRRPA